MLRITKLQVISTISSIIILQSCSKAVEEVAKVIDKPIISQLKKSDFKVDTIVKAANTWQYGFTLEALKKGTIDEVSVLIPAPGTFTVQIYRLTDPMSPIVVKNIECLEANKECIGKINMIDISANEKIGVTVIADAFFRASSVSATSVAFPIPSDNGTMRIHNFCRDTVNMTDFPVNKPVADFIAPCVDVAFRTDK